MHDRSIVIEGFNRWFASYLEQDELQVARLLRDKTATRFLIAWSIFESKCFNGFVREKQLSAYAMVAAKDRALDFEWIKPAAAHFHDRYQDKRRFRNLMHKQSSKELETILAKGFSDLSRYDIVFLLLYVVYRYRNNIFHGNKGVQSWLQYRSEIEWCIGVMQTIISLQKVTYNQVL